MTATGLEPRTTSFLNEHSTIWPNWHDQVLMLAKSKFNSIETFISQALNDMEISHEEFITVFKEKDRYDKMKYNLNENENKNQKIIKVEQHKIKN